MWSLAPGAETGDRLRDRVWNTVEGILEKHAGGNVVLMAHGGVINAYVGKLLGLVECIGEHQASRVS